MAIDPSPWSTDSSRALEGCEGSCEHARGRHDCSGIEPRLLRSAAPTVGSTCGTNAIANPAGVCAGEAGVNMGESPILRIRLFTVENNDPKARCQHAGQFQAPGPREVSLRTTMTAPKRLLLLGLGLAPEDFVVAVAVEPGVDVDEVNASGGQLGQLLQVVAAIHDPCIHQR